MNRVLKSMAIGLSLIAGSQAMDWPMNEEEKKQNKRTASEANLEPSERAQKRFCPSTSIDFELLRNSPTDVKGLVLETTAIVCFNEMSYSDSLEKLYFLMKNFCYEGGKYTVNGNWFKNAILSGYAANGVCEKDYENCLRFLNGKLIYTTDEGKQIVLPIATLKKPFSDEFDLSQCGDAGKYLSVNTGCRKGMITKNSNKVEIWFTPWFSVEKNLNSTAPHLEPIFENWDGMAAPVGIFWNWGNWDNLGLYDYLTSCDMTSISSDNLLKLYLTQVRPQLTYIQLHSIIARHAYAVSWKKFHIHFKQKFD